MTKQRLIYMPLGGAGEIGMNAYVYGYGPKGKERLILVDIGVAFPNMDTTPGVDLIYADLAWLEARKDRLEGIFITHGHEDHVGAIGLVAKTLDVPIYARSFTAHLARHKLQDYGVEVSRLSTAQAWPHCIQAGPFNVGFVPISHSIPQSSGLVIDTPDGRIIHTGDFKIDRNPIVGEPFDDALWQEIAQDGVLAMVCDSTNVFDRHEGRSESVLKPEITKLIQAQSGMVAATTFASNIARVKTLADAATDAGRSVCLLGRAMRRYIDGALETGILKSFPATISPEAVREVPRANMMLLATGSQGERRAATAQLSNGKYMGISMKEGDTFLFSSKTIPGNERGVGYIMNQFSELGIEVFDDCNGLYHVSGHANQPDLIKMRDLIKPNCVIPMHGEHRHLRKHMRLSQEAGVPSVLAVNGTMVEITAKGPKIIEHIETGRRYLDGTARIGALDGIVRDRLKMAMNGIIVVTQIMDEMGEPFGDPWCDCAGLAEMGLSDAPLLDIIEEDLAQFMGRADQSTLDDDDKLEAALTKIARNTAVKEIGKKPQVITIISRMTPQ